MPHEQRPSPPSGAAGFERRHRTRREIARRREQRGLGGEHDLGARRARCPGSRSARRPRRPSLRASPCRRAPRCRSRDRARGRRCRTGGSRDRGRRDEREHDVLGILPREEAVDDARAVRARVVAVACAAAAPTPTRSTAIPRCRSAFWMQVAPRDAHLARARVDDARSTRWREQVARGRARAGDERPTQRMLHSLLPSLCPSHEVVRQSCAHLACAS